MKQFYSFLNIIFFFSVFFTTLSLSAQIVTIPDSNLKTKLLNHVPVIDTNGDSEIQISEAQAFSGELHLSGTTNSGIAVATGLEVFVNVSSIDLDWNNLTSVDFSQLVNLQTLSLSRNDFTNFNSSFFPSSLTTLYLEENNLQNVNLSNLPNLLYLSLGDNTINTVDLSALGNLESLYLYNNNISSINSSDLPNSIQTLSLRGNSLNENNITLSSLSNLKILWLSGNDFTSFSGANFPISIEKLYLASNNFTDENSLNLSVLTNLKLLNLSDNNFFAFSGTSFPTTIETLLLSYNNLGSFNASNFPNLKELDVSHNNFISLDPSWSNIEILDIKHNNIATVDFSTYTQLLDLNISHNYLNILDISSNTNLERLYAGNNNLSSITMGNLNNLIALGLYNNQLTTIDLSQVPNLIHCGLSNNLFTELDFSANPMLGGDFVLSNLPNLEFLSLKNGNTPSLYWLNGVPNLETICVDDVDFYTYLLSDPFSDFNATFTTYCNFVPGQYNVIAGNVNLDTGAGCADISAITLPNVLVKSDDNTTNTTSSATFTNDLGEYSLYVDQGNFTSTAQIDLPPYYAASPVSHSSTFVGYGNMEQADFCFQPTQTVDDLNVTIIPVVPAKPGFQTNYKIVYENIGTTTLTGQVIFQFDDNKQAFVSAIPLETASSPNSLTFDFNNLMPFQSKEILIVMLTKYPPMVNSGDILSFTASITPNNNDYTPNDNTFQLSQTVVNAFDPNDKLVLEGDKISISDAGEYLHYLIRFQNLGTAQATNIVVTDTLSDQLDWNSIRMLSASHDYHVQITNGNFVEFIFENINLPQEAIDAIGSHGYVSFKIKPKANVDIGDIITGKAAIYFDYNAAIITNMVSTEIVENMGINEPAVLANKIFVYPNPADKTLRLKISEGINLKKVSLYTLQGQELRVFQEAKQTINVENLSPGMYLLRIATNRGTYVQQVIKK